MESVSPKELSRLLIVGQRGGTNVGECFERAATELGIDVRVLESGKAMDAPPWLRRFNWHLRGHRPTKLNSFSEAVHQECRHWWPDVLLTTGLAPVTRQALGRIRSLGVVGLNYLTDDPWNRSLHATWFMEALSQYDFVFSPRRANLVDLKAAGCRAVEYLAFAYDPSIHFVDPGPGGPEYDCDVLFIGGADRSRVPYCHALVKAGFRLSLYGNYWDRYIETRNSFRGYADLKVSRKASAAAKICLCLVRRANRDGHVMRTFEVPAMGGCMLTEDTSEHRELFGPDGEAVVYFQSIPEMVQRARWLLQNEAERRRLAATAHARITRQRNTYVHRLQAMLETVRFKLTTSFLRYPAD